MNLELARQVIRDLDASMSRRHEAVAMIVKSTESSIDDIIQCLSLGGIFAEIAATALHVRTGRQRSDSTNGSLITDAEDWAGYVQDREDGRGT